MKKVSYSNLLIVLGIALFASAVRADENNFEPLECRTGISTGHNDYETIGTIKLGLKADGGFVVLDAMEKLAAYCSRGTRGLQCTIGNYQGEEPHAMNVSWLARSEIDATASKLKVFYTQRKEREPFIFCSSGLEKAADENVGDQILVAPAKE